MRVGYLGPPGTFSEEALSRCDLVAGAERLFGRLSWGYPLLSVALGSVIVDTISLEILRMVDVPLAGAFPTQRLIAAAVLNTAIAGIALLPTRILLARAGAADRPAW